jgi:hypothetical protein
VLLAAVAALWQATNAAAANCGGNSEIVTDRPDVTNSSVVVPLSALQSENGVDLISGKGAQVLTGTNSRLRLGVSSCFEVLVDLPAYSALLGGPADSGLSIVIPALKWQISPVPGKFDLSAVAGVGLPIGGSVISGPGVQPYLQFPWSVELSERWSISGMVTALFKPSSPDDKMSTEHTFALEREIGERGFVFVEYVSDHSSNTGESRQINSGAGYRVTPTQQVDFHFALGINREAPDFVVGIGYSVRTDSLFTRAR